MRGSTFQKKAITGQPDRQCIVHRSRLRTGAVFAILCGMVLCVRATLAFPLTLGATVSGQLTDPGASEQYTFNGTPGQRIAYDALSSDTLSMNVRLVTPSGLVVFERNSRSDVEPLTLLESGNYTLTIKGNGSTTGPYSFRLVDVGNQTALPFNTTLTKTLASGVAADFYTINGQAGQRIFFDSLGASPGAAWVLYAPNNQQVSSAGIAGDFEVTLSQNGLYVLGIWGAASAPVAYSIQAVPFTLTTNVLTFGAVTSGTITKPGEQQIYTFSGTPGQRVALDALDLDNVSINTRLISPGGLVVFERNSRNDIEPITLAESGTYNLVVDGIGAAVGSFRFRLVDLAAIPALSFGSLVTKTLNPGTQADYYMINGVAGQRLYFDGVGSNSGALWYLYGPNNLQVTGASIGGDFEVTLAQSGSYILGIWGNSANPVVYSVRVIATVTPITPLTLGAAVTDTIQNPGDQHLYTFNGSAGQRIYYDSLNRQFAHVNCKLTAPNGAIVWDFTDSSNDIGPVLLTQSGTYTLTLDGNGDTVAAYAFRLLDLATAPILSVTAVTAGQLNPASSSAVYQVNGKAGQRLNFKSISATANQATWRFVSPANQSLATTSLTSPLGDVVLPTTGTYWLLIEGTADSPAALSFQVQASDLSDGNVPVSGFGNVRSGTITGGQQDVLNFTAPAGVWVYFDSLDRTANVLGAELRDPSNTVIFSVGAGSDSGPYVLPRSGNYTLTVKGAPSTTGTFKYRIMNWSGDAPPLTLNATVSAVLDPAYRTDAYAFNAQAGQRLLYDALDNNTSDNISVRLICPDGQIRFVNGSSHSDAGPFTLPLSGRYYLVFESNMSTPVKYTARLLDLSSQPDLPLSTPFTLSFDPGTETKVYKFAASPAERFAFNGNGSNGSGVWYVFNPRDQSVSGTALTGYFEATADEAGTYVLIIYGSSSTPFGATFSAYKPSTGTTNGGGELRISSMDGQFGSFTLTWNATPGQKYRVNYKTEADEPFWSDLPGDVTAAGTSASKTDPSLDTQRHRFYRIQTVP